jgi:hypothetical protein
LAGTSESVPAISKAIDIAHAALPGPARPLLPLSCQHLRHSWYADRVRMSCSIITGGALSKSDLFCSDGCAAERHAWIRDRGREHPHGRPAGADRNERKPHRTNLWIGA